MIPKRKVHRVGDSIMVSIPSDIVKELKLTVGESVSVDIQDEKIIIER